MLLSALVGSGCGDQSEGLDGGSTGGGSTNGPDDGDASSGPVDAGSNSETGDDTGEPECPAPTHRLDAFLLTEVSTCLVGTPCTSESCHPIRDDDGVILEFEDDDTFDVVPPDDPLVSTSSLVHCMRLPLTQDERLSVREVLDEFRRDVCAWSQGALSLDVHVHEVPPVEIGMSSEYGGLYHSSWKTAEVLYPYLEGVGTDFVTVTAGIRDPDTGYSHELAGCGVALNSEYGLAGAGLAWVPKTSAARWYECADAGTFMHEWLHLAEWGRWNLSQLDDRYERSYPACWLGHEDPTSWWPGVHDCSTDPDYSGCGQDNCEQEAWHRHILGRHLHPDVELVTNHCKDGVQNYGESGIDRGGTTLFTDVPACGDDLSPRVVTHGSTRAPAPEPRAAEPTRAGSRRRARFESGQAPRW